MQKAKEAACPVGGGALPAWAGSELTCTYLSFAAEVEIRGGQGHMMQGTKSICYSSRVRWKKNLVWSWAVFLLFLLFKPDGFARPVGGGCRWEWG